MTALSTCPAHKPANFRRRWKHTLLLKGAGTAWWACLPAFILIMASEVQLMCWTLDSPSAPVKTSAAIVQLCSPARRYIAACCPVAFGLGTKAFLKDADRLWSLTSTFLCSDRVSFMSYVPGPGVQFTAKSSGNSTLLATVSCCTERVQLFLKCQWCPSFGDQSYTQRNICASRMMT